jgi:hypothetical protein
MDQFRDADRKHGREPKVNYDAIEPLLKQKHDRRMIQIVAVLDLDLGSTGLKESRQKVEYCFVSVQQQQAHIFVTWWQNLFARQGAHIQVLDGTPVGCSLASPMTLSWQSGNCRKLRIKFWVPVAASHHTDLDGFLQRFHKP